MEFQKRYGQLNAAQKEAVDTLDGPVMVIAGPGTGKTELLSVRTANILTKTDTLPKNILCLTFTESGAAAMRERLVGIIGKDAYKVAIHTFHSFGTEIINQNREYFYRGALFSPADDLNRYEILRGIFDSLDYKNPLASTMNGEYTHQPDAAKVISELKRSGLTSDELLTILDASEAAIDEAERLLSPLLAGTVSAKTGTALAGALQTLQSRAQQADVLYEVTPLIQVIADSLAFAIDQTADHPTKPITAWKKKWFEKNAQGDYILKSRGRLVKLRALAFVYFEYITRMEQAGLYDYDDMILQVVHAMEVHDELRFNLQEKYLYIMVDEFQDTNLAQMRVLHNLTDNPANEGRPNIMVVGDDDQAIYSFQGADISNILRFDELYSGAAQIVLTNNYRSKAEIISLAREVIVQGSERLENRVEGLSKQLRAEQGGNGHVALFQAPSVDSERHWLVQQIAADIASGTAPADIAVLTRRHSEIQSLLPYFSRHDIAVQYERQENVLDQPAILALELLARVIDALSHGEHDTANALLPELLAHPAWGFTPAELWKLSVDAYENRQRWLEVMATTPRFLDAHSWLIEMAALAPSTALEPMIDRLIGRPQDAASSVFYQHYFGDLKLETAPASYLDCLAALRTIRGQLREHHGEGVPTLSSFVSFVALHRRLGTILMAPQATAHDDTAVHLMTAHKSKGLEFSHVYIFNAVDSVWGEKARGVSRTIGYPENLALAPAGDTADERLRLFYVAMTRAKSQLTISYSASDDRDKATLVASFLAESAQAGADIPALSDAAQTEAAELAWYEPLMTPTGDLKKILQPALQDYKLSATHLTSFLDITKGGPRAFLLDNLLHFPSAKSASAAYGSAIHRTLQQLHVHVSATGEQKPLEDILHDFEQNLQRERLGQLDFATYLQKGSDELQAYLAARGDTFTPGQKSELNFAGQSVVLGSARLTGTIDVLDVNKTEKRLVVTDYKTGKPTTEWRGRAEYEKVKLHKYRQQLMFYKLMVEHSRDYGTYTVDKGCLSFIEPTRDGQVSHLEMAFEPEELAHFEQVLMKVWERITTLDLPDVSAYDPTLKGIQAFEQDLIDGRI
jgi:DNA helicase II / ATP-dependent DNA helicase PcrA